MGKLSRTVAASPLAPWAALPLRLRDAAAYDARAIRSTSRWLLRSREHTNYTYDLTDRNVSHLCLWLSRIIDARTSDIHDYVRELLEDEQLRRHLQDGITNSRRRRLADKEVRYARRVGWYALIRSTRPKLVVETGTDKGLGSCVIAAALNRNWLGRLVTVDINPDSGFLIGGQYASIIDRRISSSIEVLRDVDEQIDLFIQDSLHDYAYEIEELRAVESRLGHDSHIISDNAHQSDALMHFAAATSRHFEFFREEPRDHWWPGDGIGLAVRER